MVMHELWLRHGTVLMARPIAKAQIDRAERSLSRCCRPVALLIYAARIVAIAVHAIGIGLIETIRHGCHAARSELPTDRCASRQGITLISVAIRLKRLNRSVHHNRRVANAHSTTTD